MGKPVLMSNVSDAGNLVEAGKNGFLFDPTSVASIADALCTFALSTHVHRIAMGQASRERAERLFAPEVILDHYEKILGASAGGKRIRAEHWIPAIPESAKQTARELASGSSSFIPVR
jgi:glycosyltransferase involved in cell wall biosynthesis